jgi:AAA ATPase domain/TIR domain
MSFVKRKEFSDLRNSLLNQENTSKVFMIQGGPGVGKTTFVRALAETMKREGWRVYSSHDADRSFISLSEFLRGLLNEIIQSVGTADRPDTPFNRRFRHALVAASSFAPVLIILDGLDEVLLDKAGTDQLIEVVLVIRKSAGSHLLLASRDFREVDSFSLWSLTRAIKPEKVLLGELLFEPFHKLCHQLGLPFWEDERRVESLRRQIRGLPKALELVADAPETALAMLKEKLGPEPSVDDIYKVLYQLHLQGILSSLTSAAKPIVQAILGFFVVLREEPHLRDLSGFVRFSVSQSAPTTQMDLWDFLISTKLVKLLGLPTPIDSQPPSTPLRLGHRSLHDYLRHHYFSERELISFHRQLADVFRGSSEDIGRRNTLHHLLKGWASQTQELTVRLCEIIWGPLLGSWNEISDSSLDDLEQIWEILTENQREAVAHKIEESLNDSMRCSGGEHLQNLLETACQLATPRRYGPFVRKLDDQTLKMPLADPLAAIRIDELTTHLQSTTGQWRLRILVDLWPGYYPLFAVEEELKKNGIFLDIVENSAEKIRLLLKGKADLIATTPGCLLGSDGESLRKLRVLGVLNRSFGADKILVDSTKIDLSVKGEMGEVTDPLQIAGYPLMVTRQSTNHMFLNWFLFQAGLNDLHSLDIRESGDYLKGLQGALDGTVGVLSTWEPYASLLLDANPSFRASCDTRDPRLNKIPLIIDLLVADCNRASRLAESSELRIFGELYDRALREERILDKGVEEKIRTRLGISAPAYDIGRKGVKFFTRSQMIPFFNAKGKQLKTIFEEVARAWRRPEQVDDNGEISHWLRDCLKDLAGDKIPAWLTAHTLTEAPSFDVALSFASEEQQKPQELLDILSQRGYSVFHYRYREPNLVGNRLSHALPDIYAYRARFCVVFYSRAYAAKRYTRMELTAAKRRRRERPGSGYLIVVKTDDAWPPGLPRDLVCISIERGLPHIADLIQEKIEAARRTEPVNVVDKEPDR